MTKAAAVVLVVVLLGGLAFAQSPPEARKPAAAADTGFARVTASGAVCDGVTDDGPALQRAIDAAVAAHLPLHINGRCATSRGLVVRNPGHPSPFAIECTNSRHAGLVWIGADNSGTLLTLGDPNGKTLDSNFQLRNCRIGGKDAKHKPATALLLHNAILSQIDGNTIHTTNAGIVCDVNCILNHFNRNYFSARGTGLSLVDANSNWIEHNEFYSCGTYCIDIQRGDTDIMFANDFEGTVGPNSSNSGGTRASVHINGWAIQLIANRFEDANGAAGRGMRSVIVESDGHGSAQTALFIGNTYGWNIAPRGPEHFITIKRGTAKFVDEQMGNRPPGGGAIIELNTPQHSVWIGGGNCDANNIWSGRFAFDGLTIAACNGYETNFMNFSRDAKVKGLAQTPGGKQPLCIDPSTKRIYQGRGGAC